MSHWKYVCSIIEKNRMVPDFYILILSNAMKLAVQKSFSGQILYRSLDHSKKWRHRFIEISLGLPNCDRPHKYFFTLRRWNWFSKNYPVYGLNAFKKQSWKIISKFDIDTGQHVEVKYIFCIYLFWSRWNTR